MHKQQYNQKQHTPDRKIAEYTKLLSTVYSESDQKGNATKLSSTGKAATFSRMV